MDSVIKSRPAIGRIVRSLFVLAVCGLTASDESNAAAQESEAHPLPFHSMCESTLFAMTDPCESCLEGMESWLDAQDCSLRSGLQDKGVTLTNNLTNFYVGHKLGGMNDSLTSGRGIDQFSNLSLINNPLGVRSVAYSTLGAWFVILNEGETIFNFLVFNARDTASTVGLSEQFADGVVLAPTVRLPTNFMELPGYQSFGGIWSSRDFASLNQSPQFLLPDVPIARQSGTWALMFEFDQFLLLTPTTANTVGISLGGRAAVTLRPIRRVSS